MSTDRPASTWPCWLAEAIRELSQAPRQALFWPAVVGGLYVAGLYLFRWPIFAALGEIGVYMLLLVDLVVAGFTIGCCLTYLIYHRRPFYAAILPIVVNLLLLVATDLAERFDLTARLDHLVQGAARQQAVEMILAGTLDGPGPDWKGSTSSRRGDERVVQLPREMRLLSYEQGHVRVYEQHGATYVVFSATRSLIGDFSGWAYRTNSDAPPIPELITLRSFDLHVRPLSPHWSWIDYGRGR